MLPGRLLLALSAAARASAANSEALAQDRADWEDIVLPPEQEAQLHEIRDQAKFRPLVVERKLSFGKGLNVLFSGPPETLMTAAPI